MTWHLNIKVKYYEIHRIHITRIIPWRKIVKNILHEYTELLMPSILDWQYGMLNKATTKANIYLPSCLE